MRYGLLLFILLFFSFNEINGKVNCTENKKLISEIRNRIRKSLVKDYGLSRYQSRKKLREFEISIIRNYVVSKSASNFEFGDSIGQFLVPNPKNLVESALIFHEGKIVGFYDCSRNVFYDGKEPCYFSWDDFSNCENEFQIGCWEKVGWEMLSSRNVDYIFTVRNFRNLWWFSYAENLFVLNLENMEIFEANKFIHEKCTEIVVRRMSSGDFSAICN
jgi:hypothetical protein